VLGPHAAGSSDPATWRKALLNSHPGPAAFAATSCAEAVPLLLEAGELGRAMMAARLCVALEARREGERLTDRVLKDEGVRQALKEVRRDALAWSRVMKPRQDPHDEPLPADLSPVRPVAPKIVPISPSPADQPHRRPEPLKLTCPHCGARVSIYAVKCRSCRQDLPGGADG
jgi:hypothetical protein